MIITIDTEKDSKESIKKAIKFLQEIVSSETFFSAQNTSELFGALDRQETLDRTETKEEKKLDIIEYY